MDDMLEAVRALALEAGDAVMTVYRSDFSVAHKDDASPVTEADARAEALIVAGLARLTPEWPVVGEEAVSAGARVDVAGGDFWLVDPLDGTKEFIHRNGEFTVNIGLVRSGRPVLGVVFAPALGLLFAGHEGGVAFVEDAGGRRDVRCRRVPADGHAVIGSRSHADEAALDAFLVGRKVASRINAGSSLKLCHIATGAADLYPRLGRTMEWDIAAGHAIVSAAGGRVDDLSGNPLGYGKANFENPHFVASGLPA